MVLRLDLHVHSVRSPDGCMELEEIAERARAAGLQGAAVCDHDRAAEALPLFSDFLLIPGTEVSTDQGHLLGLFVTRPIESREFTLAAEEIHRQGGIAVLAHPFQRSRDAERLAGLVPLLDGVEVWNSRADRKNPQANQMAADFARARRLLPFAGSDAHLPQEVGNGVTTVEAPALTLEAVKAALLGGGAETSGRRSRSWYTARSQLNKRRRTQAGPLAYLKWGAFAVKCLGEDLVRRDPDNERTV